MEPSGEQAILDGGDAAHGARRLAATEVAAITVAVRDVIDLGEKGREARSLDRLARGEAQPAVGAAMEGAAERDDRGSPRGLPHQLDRPLNRLRPRVDRKERGQ